MLFSKPVSDIVQFEFNYTYGNYSGAFVEYILLKGDNEYGVSLKMRGGDEHNRNEFAVDGDTVKKLEEILNRYNVSRWDNFSRSNKHVLDGNSFSFSLKTGSGDSISAHGYMSYPRHYAEVRKELDEFFGNLCRGLG